MDPEGDPGHRTRLEYRATLSPLEAGIAMTASVLASTAYYLARAPNHLSIRFALMVALLFAAVLTICRSFLLERKHQDRLLAEQDLKDKDSVFRELDGTAVHYKLAQGINSAQPTALHCYHGFGANTFSWSYVYKALSEQLQAQVTKHDMPGFGLTSRPRDISGYSLEHNGRLGRLVMDAELAAAGLLKPSNLGSQVGLGVTLEELQSVSSRHQAGQQETDPAVSTDDIEDAAADAAAAAADTNIRASAGNAPKGSTPSDSPAKASDSSQKGADVGTKPASANKPANAVTSGALDQLQPSSQRDQSKQQGQSGQQVQSSEQSPSGQQMQSNEPDQSGQQDRSSQQDETAIGVGTGDTSQPLSPLSSRSSWDSVSSIDSRRLSREQTGPSGGSRAQSQGIKRVLIGHSLGAACAAAEVIRHSKDIAGFIMVAPAIFTTSSQLRHPLPADTDDGHSRPEGSVGERIRWVLLASAEAVAKRATGLMLWLLQPFLVLFLRVLVRSRLFWVRGLSNAWHSREGVSDELVDAYRLPQLVRGWEVGLVRFVRARVADSRSFVQVILDAYHNRTPLSQAEKLASVVSRHGIKVLILHGVGDRLVPVTNSKRLAKLIPGADLLTYQNCGHVPQEELPQQFIDSVKSFVDKC